MNKLNTKNSKHQRLTNNQIELLFFFCSNEFVEYEIISIYLFFTKILNSPPSISVKRQIKLLPLDHKHKLLKAILLFDRIWNDKIKFHNFKIRDNIHKFDDYWCFIRKKYNFPNIKKRTKPKLYSKLIEI